MTARASIIGRKLEEHSVERIYLRQRSSDGSVNKTIFKPRLATAAVRQCVPYTWPVGFSRRKILRSSAYMISEKAIRFRHPNYNPDRAQKLTSSSMSRHLSTCNISSKSMHTYLSNLANRQTDRQTKGHTDKRTRAKTFTSPFVGGKDAEQMTYTFILGVAGSY